MRSKRCVQLQSYLFHALGFSFLSRFVFHGLLYTFGLLQEVDSVKSAKVSHETGLAAVEVSVNSLADAWKEVPRLQKAVTDQGFEAEPHFE